MPQTETSTVAVLKNGSSEPATAVATTMVTVQDLWRQGLDGMLAVSDLVDRCRNLRHPIAAPELKLLKESGLIGPDGRIHDTVKNVVLSAADGSGMNLKIRSPIKQNGSGSASSVDLNHRLAAKAQGIAGLSMAFMVAAHTFATDELVKFCDNTPDGVMLWKAFTARRDQPGTKEGFGFTDYIREVIAEPAN